MATARSRTTSPKGKPAVTAAPPAWSDLLGQATLESRDAKRPAIEVPDEFVDFARKLQTSGQRATIPVRDQDHFNELKLYFQSAADKLPNASATVVPVKEESEGADDDGNPMTVVRITGLKVSIGVRRGAKTIS